MDRVLKLLELAEQYPLWVIAALLGVGIGLYFMLRKPPIVRDAEQQLAELRREKAGKYDDFRPPS